jgi:hypothetical protein
LCLGSWKAIGWSPARAQAACARPLTEIGSNGSVGLFPTKPSQGRTRVRVGGDGKARPPGDFEATAVEEERRPVRVMLPRRERAAARGGLERSTFWH